MDLDPTQFPRAWRGYQVRLAPRIQDLIRPILHDHWLHMIYMHVDRRSSVSECGFSVLFPSIFRRLVSFSSFRRIYILARSSILTPSSFLRSPSYPARISSSVRRWDLFLHQCVFPPLPVIIDLSKSLRQVEPRVSTS